MTEAALRVGVLGGGAFGRGIAHVAAGNGAKVLLWSRAPRATDHEAIRATSDLAELAGQELLFLALPSAHVAPIARELGSHLDGSHMLVHVSRGLVDVELHTLTQVLRRETPCRKLGALGGPLVADALLSGAPSAVLVGTRFPEVGAAVRRALSCPALRVYATDDVIGVEVASAMVGLLTLAAGFAQGLGVGPGTLAVMVTRGMSEAARVGVSLGAQEKTFYGLAGYGDLIAAVAGDERPELRLGRALAGGKTLAIAGQEAGAHIEGVTIADRVAQYAERIGIETPIAATVATVLKNQSSVPELIAMLMSRRTTSE